MEAFIRAHQTVIFAALLLILVVVLTWLSVEVTSVYGAVSPLLNSGVGRALAAS